MNKKLTAELIKLGHDLADVAREKTLEYFRNSKLDTENKDQEGFDPVTIADRAAEAAMRTLIESRRPEDSIIGEEYGEKKGSSGLTWVLDPIDGTRGYISGTPTWGTLISVNESGRSIFGIIDQPYIGERFTGGFKQKAVKDLSNKGFK
jgi:fructose-1,6-bisphosphatase/inositol monophosphatase family enzyme